MFNFLKNKLSSTIKKITEQFKSTGEEVKQEIIPEDKKIKKDEETKSEEIKKDKIINQEENIEKQKEEILEKEVKEEIETKEEKIIKKDEEEIPTPNKENLIEDIKKEILKQDDEIKEEYQEVRAEKKHPHKEESKVQEEKKSKEIEKEDTKELHKEEIIQEHATKEHHISKEIHHKTEEDKLKSYHLPERKIEIKTYETPKEIIEEENKKVSPHKEEKHTPHKIEHPAHKEKTKEHEPKEEKNIHQKIETHTDKKEDHKEEKPIEHKIEAPIHKKEEHKEKAHTDHKIETHHKETEQKKDRIIEEKIIKEPPKIEETPKEKKGFFSRLFGKSEEVKEEIKVEEKSKDKLLSEIKEEVEETRSRKEETNKIEPKIDIPKEIHKETHPKTSHKEKEIQKEEHIPETIKSSPSQEIPKKQVESKEEKGGFFSKLKSIVTSTKINEEQFDEIFWDLELVMLENNVAVEVIEKVKNDLKRDIVDKPIPRGEIEATISQSLENAIREVLDIDQYDVLEKIRGKKPFIICFLGINGSGKTTSIAKFTQMLKDNQMSVVLAAGDTFRAAAIDQLQEHADKLCVRLIKHDYGSDPAAVAFDAVKHAESKNIDVVLIDTAGRMHSNTNLMQELKKIIKVVKPDLKIFVGESITGNDCTEQAKKFNDEVGIDGIILTKADVDEKGGAALSVGYVTKKPILYIGVGQTYKDFERFDPAKIAEKII